MQHTLDNPIWHALTGPHSAFALGRGMARHYPRDIAPFSAIAEPTQAAYEDLAADLPRDVEARLFRPGEEATPRGWQTISARPIVQMVAEAPETATRRHEFCALGAGDAADMLALAELARPGPFGARTHLLGQYIGYREAGRLLAMGGERLHLPGFVELSAICVHPEARGRGLGAAITLHLAHLALARGVTPFLHVFPDNPATKLYRRFGFRERARLWVIWRQVAART
jgi:predicted GNAT family acetyltransferase